RLLGHVPVRLLHLLDAHAVLLGDPGDVRALEHRRCRAVELERVPDHVDLVGVLELLERQVELTPTEVAEGAVEVGPDVDAHPHTLRPARRDVTPAASGRAVRRPGAATLVGRTAAAMATAMLLMRA